MASSAAQTTGSRWRRSEWRGESADSSACAAGATSAPPCSSSRRWCIWRACRMAVLLGRVIPALAAAPEAATCSEGTACTTCDDCALNVACAVCAVCAACNVAAGIADTGAIAAELTAIPRPIPAPTSPPAPVSIPRPPVATRGDSGARTSVVATAWWGAKSGPSELASAITMVLAVSWSSEADVAGKAACDSA